MKVEFEETKVDIPGGPFFQISIGYSWPVNQSYSLSFSFFLFLLFLILVFCFFIYFRLIFYLLFDRRFSCCQKTKFQETHYPRLHLPIAHKRVDQNIPCCLWHAKRKGCLYPPDLVLNLPF